MSRETLLVEIGTEELPPGSLRTLAQSFHAELLSRLEGCGLLHGDTRWFATPRRLAVSVEALTSMQSDVVVEKQGPAVSSAYDAEGQPTAAALGFARSCGTDVTHLERMATERGDRLVFRTVRRGRSTSDLLPGIVNASLAALPIARRMRWGARRDEFVRPVHWVVMLFGDQVVPADIMGLEAGHLTRGHRVMGEPSFPLPHADHYERALRERGSVIVDHEQRKQLIREQVTELAATMDSIASIDDELLEEVCSLVEWPRALLGRFERRFLDVPSEALISAMKRHQKYFPLSDRNGALLPSFIVVANIDSRDPDQVIGGNERVIRPRLADAAFFFAQDRQTPLWQRRDALRSIVFQTQLGSLWDKTERVAKLSGFIAEQLGGDVALCERAARLSKSDLVSEMVLEFAELQGIMGGYYALADGENPAVASAIREQYLPRHAGDVLPETGTGVALALADRLDTVVGIFGIGQPPSGSRDPFALRRAALGVLRIIVERALPLDLQAMLEAALNTYRGLELKSGVLEEVRDYILERLRAWYAEAGVPAECFSAVQRRGITRPYDFDLRVRAVAAFTASPQAQALAGANKRVANILEKQAPASGIPALNPRWLVEPAEQVLATQLEQAVAITAPLLQGTRYGEALDELSRLREPIDRFFDEVLVMTEDEQLRLNRLALLGELRGAFLAVADISALAVS